MTSDRFWDAKFAWARYAIGWIAYGGMAIMVRLPFTWQLRFGRALGRAAYALLRSRRRVARRNIEVCLSELSPNERERILKEHFEALGMSLVEMTMGWLGDADIARRLVQIEGTEHLHAALKKGRGVILWSGHFTTFELFWPALRELRPNNLCGMYKWQRNPVLNKLMYEGRGRYFDQMFAKDNIRQMLRSLRSNAVAWYMTDQSYAGKSSALIPFFDEPAMTNTAISRIARSSGAIVLGTLCRRLADGTYLMTIHPPLADFPSDDQIADTRALTKLLESFIRQCPEQYWWIHKRFKGRPAPLPDLYTTSAASP